MNPLERCNPIGLHHRYYTEGIGNGTFQHQLTGSISVVGNNMAESMDCDAVTVVGIIYLNKELNTCTFLYLDENTILLDAVHQVFHS